MTVVLLYSDIHAIRNVIVSYIKHIINSTLSQNQGDSTLFTSCIRERSLFKSPPLKICGGGGLRKFPKTLHFGIKIFEEPPLFLGKKFTIKSSILGPGSYLCHWTHISRLGLSSERSLVVPLDYRVIPH